MSKSKYPYALGYSSPRYSSKDVTSRNHKSLSHRHARRKMREFLKQHDLQGLE